MVDQRVIVTGAAGFIGWATCEALLARGATVVGVDNFNDYYDVALKDARAARLEAHESFTMHRLDIADADAVKQLVSDVDPYVVVNLAAQAGVRYSLERPDVYVQSNLVGFLSILEACRAQVESGAALTHLVYASSSSVYGDSADAPYSVAQKSDEPVSLYAATKKSNELMAHAYSSAFGLPSVGLRFFTVYGPMGRPDMAYFKFTNRLVKGDAIEVYNGGDMLRDFTYIDDIVAGVLSVIDRGAEVVPAGVPHKVYNLGNSHPEKLGDFILTLERCLRDNDLLTTPLQRKDLPMQVGDVYQTFADIEESSRDLGFAPTVGMDEGLSRFARWYAEYYRDERS
ncbi:SDR family NAD(P)-dependent oxidoreductase [Demequina sp. NBRC 110052]|uniref:SDR family NAD(P)-dependent oxidoreductase n=1 Tax=Demequina sp. NBRC 110052 TaxID=1570341 RepID=UPI00117E6550|nr:SDR family NAD(P)-dependent oxidoreductase [Demequina sp. NBRC 110052]